jgi:hypothetical protein
MVLKWINWMVVNNNNVKINRHHRNKYIRAQDINNYKYIYNYTHFLCFAEDPNSIVEVPSSIVVVVVQGRL